MAYTLSFSKSHDYTTVKDGITILVTLRSENFFVDLTAKLDTGATFCIFERGQGEALHLDIETGQETLINTPTGTFTAYGHDVVLQFLDYELSTTVYFAADYAFNRNVLGREGWLNRLRVGIVDHDGLLYLSHYDEE